MFKATVTVSLRPSILDPQGKAIQHALSHLGFPDIDRVRVGKRIDLWIETDDADSARKTADEAARKLLANAVMEDFEITLEKA